MITMRQTACLLVIFSAGIFAAFGAKAHNDLGTFTCPLALDGFSLTSFGLYDEHPAYNYELKPDNFSDPLPHTWSQLQGLELWLECDYGSYDLVTDHWENTLIGKIGLGHSKCEMTKSSLKPDIYDSLNCFDAE